MYKVTDIRGKRQSVLYETRCQRGCACVVFSGILLLGKKFGCGKSVRVVVGGWRNFRYTNDMSHSRLNSCMFE